MEVFRLRSFGAQTTRFSGCRHYHCADSAGAAWRAVPATGHGGAAAEEPVRFIRPLCQVQPRHENIDRLDFPKTALPLRQVRKHLNIAVRFTIVTTIVLGLIYPLLVTGLSQLIFPRQANGSLVERNGQIIGSRLIAQGFTADIYFHPRPSAAGAGYDPTSSGGSNLGPTNKQLVDRVKQDVAKLQHENSGTSMPADMVTTSGSGLDPEMRGHRGHRGTQDPGAKESLLVS
jgi:K+-transporting ATPase KdpC subunit